MFSLISSLVRWLFEAAVTYAASDEGGASLVVILDEAEKDGIDVPFYEASEGEVGETGQRGPLGENASATVYNKREANELRDKRRKEAGES